MILAVTISKLKLVQLASCSTIQRQIERNVMFVLTNYLEEIKSKLHHLQKNIFNLGLSKVSCHYILDKYILQQIYMHEYTGVIQTCSWVWAYLITYKPKDLMEIYDMVSKSVKFFCRVIKRFDDCW